jgi:hypothetical protein
VRPSVSPMGLPGATNRRFTRARLERDDGTFAEYVLGRLPSLSFADVGAGGPGASLARLLPYVRERAASVGVRRARVLAVHRLDADAAADDLMPGLRHVTEDGEQLLSADSAIVAALRALAEEDGLGMNAAGEMVITARLGPRRARGQAALGILGSQRALATIDTTCPGRPGTTRAAAGVLAVHPASVPSAVASASGLVFNTAFFLFEPDDVRGHHAAFYEPVGLWVDKGVIRRPPLYPRGAVYRGVGGGWQVGRFSLRDVTVELPNGLTLVPRTAVPPRGAVVCTVDGEDEVSLYTRASGAGQTPTVRDRTPSDAQRDEFTVIDRRVVGRKRGGGLLIPQNGFVVSVHRGRGLDATLRRLTAAAGRAPVVYRWFSPRHARIECALQAGPVLFRPGAPALHDRHVTEAEWFRASADVRGGGRRVGISPTDFAGDVDASRRPRTAVGIDEFGGMLLVLVTGVDRSAARPGVDSSGATLLETCDILRAAGATSAVNLDGGGSTQAYLDGEVLAAPSYRRGPDREPVERPVPSVGRTA